MRYWFDTEFIERGAEFPLRFLSIGIVSEDRREFYYEHPLAEGLIRSDFARHGDPWLMENVLPHLHGGFPLGSLNDLAKNVTDFCSPERYGKPELWAYFADYDWVVLCQLFGRMVDLPKGWPMYCRDLKQSMDERLVRKSDLPPQVGTEHNALDDARWVRDAWNDLHRVPPEVSR